MKVYQIEHHNDSLFGIELNDNEREHLNFLESKQTIIFEDNKKAIGIYSDEYINYISQLFKKYNILFTIEDITENSMNEVLDKININGIESLNETDKLILKSI